MSGSNVSAHDIRRRFLDFFAGKDHAVVPSSSLVPHADPTLLFVNAGMVQFKDVFLGRENRDYSRAVSVQRCLRAGGKHNDLENVGFTPRHQTLFEMLGNFSFGDYFKQDAIKWGWAFLTEVLGLPADRLVVSVYNGEGEDAPADEEAYELWSEILPKDRIYRLNAKENFWAMGDTGPCGPCSEIHIFKGGDKAPGDALREGPYGPDVEDDKYTELWNLVFMQYAKHDDGSMTKLPKPSVDTGMGLERITATVNGVESNYATDLLRPLVEEGKRLAGVSGDQGDRESAYQVIADHARATAFLVADGVFPDKGGRSYVLRRIMRRAIRFGTEVGLDRPFFHDVCRRVIDEFGDVYPELRDRASTINEVVQAEEEAFRRTLARGLKRLQGALEQLPQGAKAFPPDVAADLYDTYGFPLDLTALISREKGLSLDEPAAEQVVKERQSASGDAGLGAAAGIADIYFGIHESVGDTEFLGYDSETAPAAVRAILRDGQRVEKAAAGEEVELVFDRSPFYAESGGQVGDAGRATGPATVTITDTVKPVAGLHVHRGRVEAGELAVGQTLELTVDGERRRAIARNHSATHLLHHALRQVLGDHVVQKGSLVAPERLRFDFSHNRSLTLEQRQEIERLVNAEVLRNDASGAQVMGMDEAREAGAMMLFGEKYGDRVRVVSIGHESVELCGGTHVARAGDIGPVAIVSEGSIAQGVRRIEAVSGMGAVQHLQDLARVTAEAGGLLHAGAAQEVPDRIERLQSDLRERDRQIADLRRKLATGGGGAQDAIAEVAGVKLLAKKVGVADSKVLREAADELRSKLGSGVVALGAEKDGKATLLVAVTKDLQGKLHAGKVVGQIASHVDGKGGGRPDLAQAGGPNPGGLDAALDAVKDVIARELAAS